MPGRSRPTTARIFRSGPLNWNRLVKSEDSPRRCALFARRSWGRLFLVAAVALSRLPVPGCDAPAAVPAAALFLRRALLRCGVRLRAARCRAARGSVFRARRRASRCAEMMRCVAAPRGSVLCRACRRACARRLFCAARFALRGLPAGGCALLLQPVAQVRRVAAARACSFLRCALPSRLGLFCVGGCRPRLSPLPCGCCPVTSLKFQAQAVAPPVSAPVPALLPA